MVVVELRMGNSARGVRGFDSGVCFGGLGGGGSKGGGDFFR